MTWHGTPHSHSRTPATDMATIIDGTVVTAAALSTIDVAVPGLDLREQVDAIVSEGVLIMAASGSIVWCNDAACRLLRIDRAQLEGRQQLGRGWKTHRLDGTEMTRAEHPGVRALATGVPVMDSVLGITTPDDHQVWLQVSSRPAVLDGQQVAVSVFKDITDGISQRRQAALTLSRIGRLLRQPDWPDSGGVRFASRHRSVGPSREIGGDFFGAHQVSPNLIGFYIGDACGHGAQAAGMSALARHTLRSAGALLTDPSEVLKHLHDVVQIERPDTYLTAIYGYVETGAHTRIRFCAGGHPLPILIEPDGTRTIGRAGPIIGMVPNCNRPVTELYVEDGERLLLHTDGLTSTRTREIDPVALLTPLPSSPSIEELAELAVARASQADDEEDDASVLVIGIDRSMGSLEEEVSDAGD